MKVARILVAALLLLSMTFGVCATETTQPTELPQETQDSTPVLPDYPWITEGQKVSVNLAPGETQNYLFQANADGLYTQGMNYSSHSVILDQVDGYAFPEMVTPWMTDTQQGTVYRLSAGNIYRVEISSSGGPQLADEIWIRAGDAPKNEYPVWSESESAKSITLSSGETKHYYFTPSSSGEYVLYRAMSALSIDIFDGSFVRDFNAGGQYQGVVYYLNAGQQYVIELSERGGGVSDTVYLEKRRDITSAEIYLAQSDPSKGSYVLAVRTDPIYAFAEGVQWSISDSTLFKIVEVNETVFDLAATGQGTATVSAIVGGITCTYQLSTGAASGTEGTTGSAPSGNDSAQQTPTENVDATDSTQPTDVTHETTLPEVTGETAEQTTAPQDVSESIISCLELSALAEGENYAISVNGCDMIWDAAAVKSLLEQTVAAEFTLSATSKEYSELNDAQQNAIAGGETGFIWDLSIREYGAYIHNFDGTVTVKIPFVPEQGRAWNICYLDPYGAVEQMESWEENGNICFKTDHFSVFALVYEQQPKNAAAWLIWVGAGVAIVAVAAVVTVMYLKKKKA